MYRPAGSVSPATPALPPFLSNPEADNALRYSVSNVLSARGKAFSAAFGMGNGDSDLLPPGMADAVRILEAVPQDSCALNGGSEIALLLP